MNGSNWIAMASSAVVLVAVLVWLVRGFLHENQLTHRDRVEQ